MVGHTGVVEAGVKAVETIDDCVSRIVPALLAFGGKCLITADHGNCEQMRNADGSPNTAHTTNLVHFIYVADDAQEFRVENGILADVAPTLLFLLGLPQPAEMTGRNLLARLRQPAARRIRFALPALTRSKLISSCRFKCRVPAFAIRWRKRSRFSAELSCQTGLRRRASASPTSTSAPQPSGSSASRYNSLGTTRKNRFAQR